MRLLHGSTEKVLNSEKGLALVSALLLGTIGMLMVAALLLMVNTGTWISGSKKRYQMALDAAHGGMNFYSKEIIRRGLNGDSLSTMGTYGGILTPVISNADLTTKLTTTGLITDGTFPNDPVDVIATFALPSGPSIAVNMAILSTSRGNSSTSSNLLQTGGVVNNNSGTITPQHIPYLYEIEAQGQNSANPIENARLSSLYIY
jgi:hypothetical protein